MWDGHSCPSPLTLVLKWQRIPNVDTKINIKTKIKIKGDGQECPSHKGSYHQKFMCSSARWECQDLDQGLSAPRMVQSRSKCLSFQGKLQFKRCVNKTA